MAPRVCSVLAFVLVACGGSDDSSSSGTSDLESGRGALTRSNMPLIAVPTSPLIGAKLDDVQATANATLGDAKRATDCITSSFHDGAGVVVLEKLDCQTSTTLRFVNADGTVKYEHADLNKDGLVDRYTSSVATDDVAQYTDANFDGKVDVLIERVDQLEDFSLDGYGESFPQADFLYRIREDRNRDGAFDHETLTAKGALPGAG